MMINKPVWASSSPFSFFIGQSTFSAPSYLRIFFHKTFESIDCGSPEMTMVRIANGSWGSRGWDFGGGRGLGSFFNDTPFSPLSFG